MPRYNKAEEPCINCPYNNTGFCNNRYECAIYQVYLDGGDVQDLTSIGQINIEMELAGLLDNKKIKQSYEDWF